MLVPVVQSCGQIHYIDYTRERKLMRLSRNSVTKSKLKAKHDSETKSRFKTRAINTKFDAKINA